MTQYYLSAAGNDSNAGTSTGAPWLTLSKSNSATTSGDTISLRGGDTFAGPCYPQFGQTINSYGTGRATIDGGSGNSVYYSNGTNMTLQNVIVTGDFGVTLNEDDGTRHNGAILIDSCDISGADYGVSIVSGSASGTGGFNGITISSCTIHNTAKWGIISNSVATSNTHFSNIQIINNVVHDITGDTTSGSGSGIGLQACDSTTGTGAAQCVISGNLVYDCGYDNDSSGAGAGPCGIQTGGISAATGVLVESNVVHDITPGTVGNDAEGIIIGQLSSNCIAQYNYIYDCWGSGIHFFSGLDGNIARFNMFIDNCSNGRNGNGSINYADNDVSYAYNNTIVSTSASPGIYFLAGQGEHHFVCNNLILTASGAPAMQFADSLIGTGMTINGNAYQSGSVFLCQIGGTTYSSLGAWQSGSGKETSTGFGPPVNFFVGGSPPALTPSQLPSLIAYSLAPGSPLYHAGIDLLSIFGVSPGAQDFLGAPIPVPYSVGAINAIVGGGSFHGSSVCSPTALPLSTSVVGAKYY